MPSASPSHPLLRLMLAASCIVSAQACMPEGAVDQVTIGKETYVCVTLGPLNWYGNGTALRIAATPFADEISSVKLRNAWSDLVYSRDFALSKLSIPFAAGAGMGVTVSSMGKMSYQRAFRSVQVSADGIEGITFPLLMAIIHVDKGKVTGINWDSTCSWCDPDQCSQSVHDFGGDVVADGGNCFVKDSACLSDVGTTRLCELNVNIVWTGTDSEERYFLSSTPRFSRLTAEQITDYTDRLDGESKLVDFLPSGQPTSAPTNPTGEPTSIPTSPTGMPTRAPTKAPSVAPSPSFPTGEPTSMPSEEQAVNASTIL